MTSPPVPSAFVTRFAPSPTGRLHLGHAFSALTAFAAAREAGGRFLLRVEDIDGARCRSEFADGILEDLAWLGLQWEEPVRYQSHHIADYRAALDRLEEMGVLYPCLCSRREIAEEIARAPSAPHGPEGPLYPGTCRKADRQKLLSAVAAGAPAAWRLDCRGGLALLEARGRLPLRFVDEILDKAVTACPERLGDVVLGRKDVGVSYHIAVVCDDAAQGISHVIRGEDLLASTHIHVLLQALLELPTPLYRHHRLLTDTQGQRLAKRDRPGTLEALRASGVAPADLRRRLGFEF